MHSGKFKNKQKKLNSKSKSLSLSLREDTTFISKKSENWYQHMIPRKDDIKVAVNKRKDSELI